MPIDSTLYKPLEVNEGGVQEQLRAAMRRLASTVAIVTTNAGGTMHGTTVTALTALSLDPPALLICLSKATRLARLLVNQRQFCVNLLHHDNLETSKAFSQNLTSEERFANGNWRLNGDEPPYLADAQANLFCDKDGMQPYGSHWIFIGRVTDIRVRADINPLLYADGGYRDLQTRRSA
jgi:flavin reductase (DIM6/NTAB) family NADH-FMN oxidoreductase RutF